jgi:DnaJ-domain-containing protein 1
MWPLSRLKKYTTDRFQDPLDFVSGYQGIRTKHNTANLPEEIQESIKIMEIDYPLTIQDLKKAYKLKAKEYHPDINSGSKKAEEKLKLINIAYKKLESFIQNAVI